MEEIFSSGPEFCSNCGSILPLPTGKKDFLCFVCQAPVSKKGKTQVEYVIHFNDPDVYSKERTTKSSKKGRSKESKEVEAEGPLVDRECRECGHKQMSYATLQLRSADEGQTVFYTCPKCQFKESENS